MNEFLKDFLCTHETIKITYVNSSNSIL